MGKQINGGPRSGGLVGLVHGLGLLIAGVMALSGMLLYFLIPEGGAKLTSPAGGVAEIHELALTFMWI